MLSLTMIAQILPEAPNWMREYYTVGLLTVIFGGILAALRVARPLFDAWTKGKEYGAAEASLRLQTAQSVERTAGELKATATEAGRVTVAQAEVTKAQSAMTENLIRLQERVKAGTD